MGVLTPSCFSTDTELRVSWTSTRIETARRRASFSAPSSNNRPERRRKVTWVRSWVINSSCVRGMSPIVASLAASRGVSPVGYA